jgi:hypothetical protein
MLYSDFIKSKIVSHDDNIDTYYDGIKHLIESKADIVSYNTQKNLLFNVAVLEVDKNGDYIYEYSLERQADIIDNIHIVSSNNNVKMKFIIGEEEYDHILNTDLRKKITTRGNIIKTDTNIYTDGMCGRI